MVRTLALDIECVPTTDDPDFSSPRGKWDTFAISLSHRSAAGDDPETAVFVRRNGTGRALATLLCAVANWIRERHPHDTLLSFNGGEWGTPDGEDDEGFDLSILSGHIDAIEARDPEFAAFVRETLDIPHRDLFAEIVDTQPPGKRWPSLDESLRQRDLGKATPKLDGVDVTGADMPSLGAKVLSGDGLRGREKRVLREYAASDVRPLHPLADRLDAEQVGEPSPACEGWERRGGI